MDETRRRDPTAATLFFLFPEYLSLSDEERVGKRIAPEGCQPLIKKPFGLRRSVILSSSPAFTDNAQSLKLTIENYSENGNALSRKVNHKKIVSHRNISNILQNILDKIQK